MTIRILATGAAGMVGSYLPEVVERLTHADLDVTDRLAVERRIAASRPDVVLHLAAATNVDRAEHERLHAFRTNVLGTLHVALACEATGSRMVYVSTGSVFGGEKRASVETDQPDPSTFYAWTKYEGEQVVQDLLPDALIVRTGWMMGGGPNMDHKFVGTMARLLRTERVVRAVADRFGSPTYARQFLAATLRLAESGATGIWHCASEGICSRYEMAVEMARLLGFDGEVVAVDSSAFAGGAPRGASEGLDCAQLRAAGLGLPDWRAALAEYLTEFRVG